MEWIQSNWPSIAMVAGLLGIAWRVASPIVRATQLFDIRMSDIVRSQQEISLLLNNHMKHDELILGEVHQCMTRTNEALAILVDRGRRKPWQFDN